jgi:amino acid adenylation domain-containing protein
MSDALSPNFASLLWRRAAERPGHAAIAERDTVTTYAQLKARAGAVAARLAAASVRPGDRVAIFLERGPEEAAVYFGTLAAGAVVIAMADTLRPRQMEHVLHHSGARALLTTRDMLSRLPRTPEGPGTQTLLLDGLVDGEQLDTPVPRVGRDVAQIIYTSGSTGLPKGVTLCHDNISTVTRIVVSYLELKPEDRIASLMPFSYVYGLNQLFCVVGIGATLVVERSPLERSIVDTLRKQRVTVLACVPPLWLRLLDTPSFRDQPLPDLRIVTNAGGRLPPSTVQRLRQAQPHARLFLMYGMTETLRGTYLDPTDVDRHPDSMGKAIPESEIMVLREDGTPCGPDEVGELVQRGPTVALGYWNDPEAPAKVFRPNPLRPPGTPDAERVVFSGDMVRRDAEGFLYHHGRADRMFKTLGYRVSPDEITDVLYASGRVREAIIVPEQDDVRGTKIVAHVSLLNGSSLDQLVAFCKLELPRHMQPVRYQVWPELPRNPNGKHDMAALTAR